jgi:hypothetical protein
MGIGPLDDHCGQVTLGFKIVDTDAIDPIGGNNIFSELDNMQSCNWCFPIMMMIAKSEKDTYDKYLQSDLTNRSRFRLLTHGI